MQQKDFCNTGESPKTPKNRQKNHKECENISAKKRKYNGNEIKTQNTHR